MILKRIEPMSCAKVYGLICVFIGLIAGIFVAGIFWVTSHLFGPGMDSDIPLRGMSYLFGGGAIISFPIMYGIMGFIMGYLSAVIYNWIANMIGGIEMEFDNSYEER